MKKTLLSVLFVLLSLPMQGRGQVLCIGADGHIAFESAPEGKCCDGAEYARIAAAVLSSLPSAADCGDCTDILIRSNTTAYRASRLDTAMLEVDLPALAVTPCLPEIAYNLAVPLPARPAMVKAARCHLRSVSLVV